MMKKVLKVKIAILICFIGLSSFVGLHKYYVGVTEVEFVPESKSVQVISRLFIDDFQNVLTERYAVQINLDKVVNENQKYINQYYAKKLIIKINNKQKQLQFVGSKLEDDKLVTYFEIENISDVKTFSITNKLLFDGDFEQQNITHINIKNKKKSVLLYKERDTELLKF